MMTEQYHTERYKAAPEKIKEYAEQLYQLTKIEVTGGEEFGWCIGTEHFSHRYHALTAVRMMLWSAEKSLEIAQHRAEIADGMFED